MNHVKLQTNYKECKWVSDIRQLCLDISRSDINVVYLLRSSHKYVALIFQELSVAESEDILKCATENLSKHMWLGAKIELSIVRIICCVTVLTSSMTEQMCLTHWVMACGVPEIVTALSVESGSMSPATWTWAPVVLTSPDNTRNKFYLLLKRGLHHPDWKAGSGTHRLPWTHFDMQGAAASQIVKCALIFAEAYTNIVHSEREVSLHRSLWA